jgi:hypothetical protein
MPLMANKRGKNNKGSKPAGDAESKKGKRTGVSLHVYIGPALREAMDKLIERDRRSLTTEVEMALENHLKEKGLWPPKPAEDELKPE